MNRRVASVCLRNSERCASRSAPQERGWGPRKKNSREFCWRGLCLHRVQNELTECRSVCWGFRKPWLWMRASPVTLSCSGNTALKLHNLLLEPFGEWGGTQAWFQDTQLQTPVPQDLRGPPDFEQPTNLFLSQPCYLKYENGSHPCGIWFTKLLERWSQITCEE